MSYCHHARLQRGTQISHSQFAEAMGEMLSVADVYPCPDESGYKVLFIKCDPALLAAELTATSSEPAEGVSTLGYPM